MGKKSWVVDKKSWVKSRGSWVKSCGFGMCVFFLLRLSQIYTGAKLALAPFNGGGLSARISLRKLMMACRNIYSSTSPPVAKKILVSVPFKGLKNFFRTFKKKGSKNLFRTFEGQKNFFGHILVKTCLKPTFLDQYRYNFGL